MMRTAFALLLVAGTAFTGLATAHPMGNLSINHYARIEPSAKGIDVTWVLDLAEIPTFELTQTWKTPTGTDQAQLDQKAAAQAKEWIGNLVFRLDGRRMTPTVSSTTLAVIEGAGSLPVFRITSTLHLLTPPGAGRLEYEDLNFATRAGWREIVVRAGDGAELRGTSAGSEDVSHGLTAYPQDPTKAPPQETKAWLEWKTAPVAISKLPPQTMVPVSDAAPVVESGARPPEAQALGTVKRDDSISRILRMKSIPPSLMFVLAALAFWFGALHALEPGHGKTMVAAYLVGEKGTAKHAVFLGGMVTFTHTVSVFLLGLATMFLSRYVMPEKISKFLGIVSGLSIVWIGAAMLWRRAKTLPARESHSHGPHQHHHHDHDHGHPHHHHGDEHAHSHVPEGGLSLSSLIALGASGGLVPCPSALILLLSAISIGRPGLGVMLLLSFSVGLALVLTCTGLLVVYAKNLLPAGRRTDNAFFRLMPVLSAAAVLVIGMLMTGASLGWMPVRFSL